MPRDAWERRAIAPSGSSSLLSWSLHYRLVPFVDTKDKQMPFQIKKIQPLENECMIRISVRSNWVQRLAGIRVGARFCPFSRTSNEKSAKCPLVVIGCDCMEHKSTLFALVSSPPEYVHNRRWIPQWTSSNVYRRRSEIWPFSDPAISTRLPRAQCWQLDSTDYGLVPIHRFRRVALFQILLRRLTWSFVQNKV